MNYTQIATALSDIAKASGWSVAILTEGSDVIGVVLTNPDDMKNLLPYGYDFSLMAMPDRTPHD